MSIRQIFDHIQASENKVFLTPISIFSEISEFQRNFKKPNYLRKQSGRQNRTEGAQKDSKTRGIHLFHHLLFIKIRQIFDHNRAGENKVYLPSNSQNLKNFDFFSKFGK